MYLAHSSRRLLLRLVVTGVPGAGGVAAIERLHERIGGELLAIKERGSWRTRQLEFRPEDGPEPTNAHGYELHVLLHGVDADGEDADPCDVSSMRDVDGVILLASPERVSDDVAAGKRLAAALETMGYKWASFPFVIALDADATSSDATARLYSELAMGERPIIQAPLEDGLPTAVEALLELSRAFVRAGRVHVVEESVDVGAREGTDEAVLVRSPLELHLYESLRPCSCGAADFEVKQSAHTEGAFQITARARRCRRCGREATLRFAVPEEALARGPDWLGGPDASTALDAGELIELSERCGVAAKGDSPAARRSLVLAIALLEDALRLSVAGVGIPHERFTSRAGRAHLRYAGTAGLPRLRTRLEAYRRRLPN